jgi:hypothetical protein
MHNGIAQEVDDNKHYDPCINKFMMARADLGLQLAMLAFQCPEPLRVLLLLAHSLLHRIDPAQGE